jgi:dipeptidyl aminopeptidase/acylaminoacyl peptidase
LAGATFTPDIYQCAVSIAGVSDLLESLREERRDSRFSSSYHYWRRSIGDPGRDREALIATSPARQAARIQIPVLLLHGEDDGIVPARQSELMEEALREAGKEVRYQHYEEEGHPFGDWEREHEIAVYREVERFLAQHLGE